jgi:hypothetical protein
LEELSVKSNFSFLGVVALSAYLLVGCGATTESTNPISNSPSNTSSNAPSNTPPNTTASAPAPTANNSLDAKAIVYSLKSSGMPIGKMEVYTESNDPNKLLGRPGQYTSKVNFVDKQATAPDGDTVDVSNGGSVEVFASESDAKNRYDYVSNIAKSSSMFAEYDFRDGNVVLRISHDLTPTQEKQYETALTKALK